MGEHRVVHLPELALARGGLRRFGGQLRVPVHVVERQVPPHIANVVAKGREQLADDRLSLAAVRALEIAVLDECHRRVIGAADVVALRVHVAGEVEDVFGRGPDLTGKHPAWQSPVDRKHAPRHRGRQKR